MLRVRPVFLFASRRRMRALPNRALCPSRMQFKPSSLNCRSYAAGARGACRDQWGLPVVSNRPDLLQFRMALSLVLYLAIWTGFTALAPRGVDAQDEAGDTAGRWSETLEKIRAGFPEVAHISADTLQSWLDESPKLEHLTLLDVREPDEFAVSHLRRAHPAPSNDEAMEALQDAPANRRIVLYCSVGYRSSELAGFLMKKGYTKVFNLEGSIFRWANEGRPLYRGKERVRVVHPYDTHWGRLLKKPLHRTGPGLPRAPRATPQ